MQSQPVPELVILPKEASVWWGRALSVFIGITALSSALGVVLLSLYMSWGGSDFIDQWENEHPGEYPENGTEDEQRSWNYSMDEYENNENVKEMMQEYESSGIYTVSLITGIILFFLGIPAAILAWMNHEMMLKVCGAWAVAKLISDVVISILSANITASYLDSVPGGSDYSWLAYTSTASSIFCGSTLLAIVIAISWMYKPSLEIPESAFHSKEYTGPE